jgi:murein DD-endopeptidase MepM/ murein hydrolase activator NlpD
LRERISRTKIASLAISACALAGASAAPALAQDAASPDAAQTAPPANRAHISGGGISAPGKPVAQRVVCKTGCLGRRKATPGAVVKIKGLSLDYASQMVFRGTAGPMPVSLTYRDSVRVRAIVPPGALSSRPYVIDEQGERSNRTKRKLTISAALPPAGPGVFPIQGPHSYGDAGSRFGAARNGHTHQGQDVAAACGTPLVSVMNATVQYAGYQASGAGYYIVLDNNGTEDDFVYMHLAAPATVRTVNAPVAAGQQIGVVGQTGDAEGCHLHFEYWQGDWYGGGHPIDPLPSLLAWDPTA